jgi:hypothetical protein
MHVYKYTGPNDGLRILRDGEITASKPSSFNDPFELLPSSRDYDVDIDILVRLSNPTFLNKLYINEQRQGRFLGTFDLFLNHLKENYTAYYANLKRSLNGAQFSIKEWIHELADGFYGVFSTSEAENNLLMWAHYGKKHSGLMIEFDGDCFKANGPYKVAYGAQRPASNFSLYGDNTELSKNVLRLMTTKSDHWTYEKEQRFFFLPKQCISKECTDGETRNLYRIEARSIRRVVLGIRSDLGVKEKVKELLSIGDYGNVLLKKAVVDENEYLIREIDV